MSMHNPPHPGEFIYTTYIEPFNLSYSYIAKSLDVAPSTFNRLLKQQSGVSSEMAIRLSKVLGRSPESWLLMQDNYDLWHAKKKVNLSKLSKVNLEVA